MRQRADDIEKYIAEHPNLPRTADQLPGMPPQESIEGGLAEAARLRAQADSMDAARRDSVLAAERIEAVATSPTKATKAAKAAPAKAGSAAVVSDAPPVVDSVAVPDGKRLPTIGEWVGPNNNLPGTWVRETARGSAGASGRLTGNIEWRRARGRTGGNVAWHEFVLPSGETRWVQYLKVIEPPHGGGGS